MHISRTPTDEEKQTAVTVGMTTGHFLRDARDLRSLECHCYTPHGVHQPAGKPADRFRLFIPNLGVNDETGGTMPKMLT